MHKIKSFGNLAFSALRIYNYRLYFIGLGISFIGTWMQAIAQGLLVLQLTGSGTILGVFTGLQFMPVFFLSPFAGVLIDRFPLRRVILITQTLLCILSLLLGVLVITGVIRLWVLYILALAIGVVNSVDNPARNSFNAELVGKNLIKNAVALNSSEINAARIIGPVIASAIILFYGFAVCFLFNALSFIAMIIALLLMDKQQLYPNPRAVQVKGQVREGFRYIRRTPVLFNTLLMAFIIGTLSYEFAVILPLFAEFTFHTKTGYAAMMAAMGLGAVIGGIFAASRHDTPSSMLSLLAFLFGLTLLFTAVAPTLQIALFTIMLVGFMSINFTSLASTTLQLHALPHMRGRVMSLWSVAFLGSTVIGGPIIGWIGEHIGPRWGLAVGGLAAVVAAGLGSVLVKYTSQQIKSKLKLAQRQIPG